MRDVAAFDFDGTLTKGGSVVPFLVAATSRRRVLDAVASLAPRLLHGAVASGPAADRAKEALFERVLGGLPTDHLATVGPVFAEAHLRRRLRRDVADRLEWHRDRGDRVVIVSASPEAYVGPAGRLLGSDAVVATRLESVDGVLTGRYDGANCRGDEKLRRLRRWIEESGERPERLWAYGNSRGDLRMLAAADVGVNAGRLGRVGCLRGLPPLGRVPEHPKASGGGA